MRVMDPAERELREELRPLVQAGSLEVIPHEGWLTTEADFMHASASCLRLLLQDDRRAASRAAWIAGSNMATRMAMIAITTRSSMSVKPARHLRAGGASGSVVVCMESLLKRG